MASLYEFEANSLDGKPFDFNKFKGKVVLVVNTASKCGLTPQYEGLEQLFKTYGPQGLEVVGFPCNQFAGQEPGDADAIGEFCQKNYGVSFRMMEKIDVNGADTHPLYRWLKSEAPGLLGSEAIKWNFAKFLLGRDGKVIERYAPTTEPKSLIKDIESALKA
jgi:glutathione peroxidase